MTEITKIQEHEGKKYIRVICALPMDQRPVQYWSMFMPFWWHLMLPVLPVNMRSKSSFVPESEIKVQS